MMCEQRYLLFCSFSFFNTTHNHRGCLVHVLLSSINTDAKFLPQSTVTTATLAVERKCVRWHFLFVFLLSVFPLLIALPIHEQEEARQTLVIPGLVRSWVR